MPAFKQRKRGNWRQHRRLVAAHIAQHGYYCPGLGRRPHYSARLTLDHITPLVLGGLDTPSNWRVLCQACNSRGGAMLTHALHPRRVRHPNIFASRW